MLGAVGIRWKKIRMLNPYKSALVGIGAGLGIWLVLFLPTTVLLIQPSIQHVVVVLAVSSQKMILSQQLSQSVINISYAANSISYDLGGNIWVYTELFAKD